MKSVARRFASALKSKYSSQAALKSAPTKPSLAPQDVKISHLPNGVVVASVENLSPVTRVAVLYNAGCRYEDYDNQGVTNYLRMLATQSTKKATGFGISRTIQQIGGNITCTTNREQVIYSVEALRSHLEEALTNLDYVANATALKPWEISDIKPHLILERDHFEQCLDAKLIEHLHRAAYRDTLGQSLYISRDKIGSITECQLQEFVSSHYVSHNAAVVGIGLDHEQLLHYAKNFHFVQGKPPTPQKAVYHRGEIREDIKTKYSYVACVTEGLGFASPDMLPLSLLQHCIGIGPSVKYSSNQVSKLYKAASAAATGPFAVSCINTNYSDSGLFGLNLVSEAKDSRKILKALFSVMNQAAKGKITDAEVQKAKNHLKATLHQYNENSTEALEWLGIEVLLSGQYLTQKQLDSAIDKISLDDVVKVAKKVITGKPCVAAVGNLSHTPYLDELFTQ
ncbi:hypothetical protein HELRODRAFT_185865 [Helobdella robusta]|uniref:Uncharacterized protein n=1 Tax=Helobdella robusta TaxID=6412 RepID=T1FND4_HELRO|nr:hypothetical protein HELRODRAFT_185865 [Helobdella robusta]ESN98311.1 hypothetical protein HELRODRAFT_185865 [Helobdella robusta]